MMNFLSLSEVRPVRRDLLWLAGLALLVRLLAALPQQQPNYMDAAYSYVNALNLASGRGFVEDFVWNYLGQPGPPPHPSHLYWMPLTSILAWLGMAVGGTSYRAAQIPFVILSALLAPITYGITYLLSGQRRSSWLAGLLAIFSGFYFPLWTAIDNFTPFAVAGSLALLVAWRGMEGRWRIEDRGWRIEDRGWKMEDGRWRIEDRGESREDREEGRGEAEQFTQPATQNLKLETQNPQPKTRNLKPEALNSPWLVAAGALTGLAHLARADGPLLLIAIWLLYLLYLTHHAPRTTHHVSRITYHVSRITYHVSRFTLSLLLGYLLIMTPWFVRNWRVVGTLLPATGSQTIWLASYDELYSYGREFSPQTFLAQGWGPILQGRWWVLTTNLQRVLAEWGMIFLTPLALLGAWQVRQHLLVQLAGLYAGLLFMAMTLVFAFPGALGGLFHSGGAVLPFVYATTLVGLDGAVDWLAARRRHWDARVAKPFFGVGLVLLAITLSGLIYYQRVLKDNNWNNTDSLYPLIAAWVVQQDPAAMVMINNPPAYRYHGGGLSVVVPNENIEVTLQAARRYGVDYLILDHNRPAALAEIYTATVTHPALSLAQTYRDEAGRVVYIFKIAQP